MHQRRRGERMKCCITGCKNKAEAFVGNNLMSGRIPFCKKCLKLMEIHWKARESLLGGRNKDNLMRSTYYGKKFLECVKPVQGGESDGNE